MVGAGPARKALEFPTRALALDPQMVEALLHKAAAAKALGKTEIVREIPKRWWLGGKIPRCRGEARLVGGKTSANLSAVIYDASLDELLQKVWDGKRINQAEALRLYHLPLEELGALADRRRQLAKAKDYDGRGNEIVTYNVDRNVNYTNVCNVYCKFCAFYRVEKDDDSYVITLDEMDKKIEETVALGGTQILMQGGHHPKLTKQWYLDLLSHIKNKCPQVNIHGFSPSEFIHFREVFNEPLEKIIGDFKAAGLGSIPGGGGEILVDRVRQRISPLKAMSNDWLEVMDVAHRLGLYSSATMMFGHVETIEDRIEHLDRLRAQQDISAKRDGGIRRHGVKPAISPRSSAGRFRPSTRS